MLVGMVEGSPSSTESSLIETSITVPAVNAAFYACARHDCISLPSAAILFTSRNLFQLARPAATRFDESDIDTGINGAKSCDTSLSQPAREGAPSITFLCLGM